MDKFFSSSFPSLLMDQMQHLPFFLLQGAAIIGFVAILLLFQKNDTLLSANSYTPGCILGVSCFFMAALLYKEMQTDLKLAIMTEYIFVAGFIGGWRNALISLIIVFTTRIVFGGTTLALPAFIDYACAALGSIPAHHLVFTKRFSPIGVFRFFLLIAWRAVVAFSSPIIMLIFKLAPIDVTTQILTRRAFSPLTVSLFVIGAVYFFFRNAAEQEARSNLDKASGLPDHQAFLNHLTTCIENKLIHLAPCSLLLVEVNNVNELRQTLGYAKLNALLGSIGKQLNESLHCTSCACKRPAIFSFPDYYFALVFHGVTKEDLQQQGLAQALLNEVSLNVQKHDYPMQPSLTASVIDLFLSKDFDPVRFLRALMLVEKRQHGHVQFLEPTIAQQVSIEERILETIKKSASGAFVPVWLQPKVILADLSCYGAEALMRVPGLKDGSYINPHTIMVTAEKHRLRQELEWGIIRSVVKHLNELPQKLMHLKISVNLTPAVFTVPGFSTQLQELLRQNSIAPARLILEIIETSKLEDSKTVQDNFNDLIENKFILSLDDFGTGYSSLTLLSRYLFKELKIDYSMTSRISDPRMYSAIQLSVESARRYQAKVVAEGIETEEQREILQDLGVMFGQGYLFGKAMPFEEFLEYADSASENEYAKSV